MQETIFIRNIFYEKNAEYSKMKKKQWIVNYIQYYIMNGLIKQTPAI